VDQAAQTCALRPRTLYFGGGTPTALRTEQLAFLLEGLRQRLDLSALQEWTVEANPSTVRPEKARLLRQSGVTRVSLGVQSWTDSTLKTLGRTHSAEQARHTFTVLRAEKFPSLNIDLMFSVPGQSHADWERDLAETLALRPDHVSCYCLTYEEDTEFFRKLTSGRFAQNEEKDAALFETTMDRLEAAGFDHYEISNYARPGHCSLHNLAYWQGADFWGFGPSAFSTRGTQRTQNVCNTTEYVRRLHADLSPTASVETLPESTRARERILFGLRMRSGVESLQLDPWAGEVQHLLKIGLLEDAGTRIRLTRRGRLLADLVGESFVDAPLP
jgi:oxygen-independent coproporphyrinogen-3 oxidase